MPISNSQNERARKLQRANPGMKYTEALRLTARDGGAALSAGRPADVVPPLTEAERKALPDWPVFDPYRYLGYRRLEPEGFEDLPEGALVVAVQESRPRDGAYGLAVASHTGEGLWTPSSESEGFYGQSFEEIVFDRGAWASEIERVDWHRPGHGWRS